MTTPHHFPSDPDSLEGRVFRPANAADLAEAVERAFDYRGDVTLELSDGRQLEGYLFNRQTDNQGLVQVFPADGSELRTLRYRDIAGITFSGRDTASGKS